jgi:hypothetical protein
MIDKVYMNLQKNEAYLLFEDGRVITLSSDECILEFYAWFTSKTYYPLGEREEHEAQVVRSAEDTQIIDLTELDDAA